MKHKVALTVASLLSLLFMTFHLTHDVIRQAEGAVAYPVPVIVFALWLYGTLVLSHRVWGYVIMLLGGLFGAAMIVVHSNGTVVGKSGGFFFVWTMFALSTTGWVTMILSARGLWTAFRSRRTTNTLAVLVVALSVPVKAQLATVGGGVLLSNRAPEPVAELHAETPPIVSARAYGTVSWTDESAKPTVITAAERPVIHVRAASVGLGAGLLWLESNDYRPYPIVVSSTVVPLPLPRTAFVAIASTQPFQDFEWSLVLKLGVTFWFVR